MATTNRLRAERRSIGPKGMPVPSRPLSPFSPNGNTPTRQHRVEAVRSQRGEERMTRTNPRRMALAALSLLIVVVALTIVLKVNAVDAAGPPEGLETTELNVDADGFIAVHEQGVADVNVTNATLSADVTFPASQTVDGTVSAQQSGTWNVGITGNPTVNVGNLPSPSTPQMDSASEHVDDTVLRRGVPSDVIVTDILASFENVVGECVFRIHGPGGVRYFGETIEDDETVVLNLTTGMGPIERFDLSCRGAEALATITWTGYILP